MAVPEDDPKSREDDRRPASTQRPDAKARFARAMARAEFGRFYWNAEAEQALRTAMKKKPAR